MHYFYAYHGPQNEHTFKPEGGYGISSKTRHARVKVGDRVFIIQRLAGKASCFYLCGEYEVTGHSINPDSGYPYRFALKDLSRLDPFIMLDPLKVSEILPHKGGDQRFNLFQRHFCSQGASFAAPLAKEVVDVLTTLAGSHAEGYEPRSRREDGLRMVKVRMDQGPFRREVLDNWHGRCAVTGSSLALEACHIISHANQGKPSVENGIALAADLHHLFDNGDLSFHNNKVILSERAQKEERYQALHNKELGKPKYPVNINR
ncbi:HNH endonuclease [Nissabacter sp. SGAir0207]|uniref:HNH endonuclease n=1 Tax=Nissabacter sp. SGAir0207 TaxID=2126321 RepID=UPI0010CD433A|nr:HNH endonuclease [Nissabacter sp. SGAir0207]QCR38080.1 hypothetical protein C1N62_18260 [Nissabacter sp. SGAir0207]